MRFLQHLLRKLWHPRVKNATGDCVGCLNARTGLCSHCIVESNSLAATFLHTDYDRGN